MLNQKEKWLRFHNGQYQLKVPFMLYVDFEKILKVQMSGTETG